MKRQYLLLIIGLAFLQTFCGQNPKSDSTKKSTEAANSQKPATVDSLRYIPKAKDWVNDYVHLFSQQQINVLDTLISTYERKTTVEFAIATIDSSMMGPIDFESYTLLLMRTWGVGKKEKNNGVLMVIAPGLKRIRIQNGYGIEKVLTNEETKIIIDNEIIPHFKKGEFYEGTKEGMVAIMEKLENTRR